jgi:hypothetical protein
MADALYALEKLADAADALEIGAGSVHERLFEAFTYLMRIGPEDMPGGERGAEPRNSSSFGLSRATNRYQATSGGACTLGAIGPR